MKHLIIVLFVLSFTTGFSQESVRKNSVLVESNFIASSSVSYDRYVPVAEKVRLIFGAEYIMGTGFGWGSHWAVPEVGIGFFGPKHFLETGVQYAFDISPYNQDIATYGREDSFGTRLAYRFETNGGFNIRAVVNAYFEIDPIILPTIGVGYSF